MKTVEVVIKIDKNTFDAVNGLSKFVDDNHIINGYQMKGHSTVGSMITAIANGTVLPKGHTDLIDRQDLIHALEQKAKRLSNPDTVNGLCGAVALVYDAPTIVESDKEGDNEC